MARSGCDPRGSGCDSRPLFTNLGHYHIDVPEALDDQPQIWYVGLSTAHAGYTYLRRRFALPGFTGILIVLSGELDARSGQQRLPVPAGKALVINHDRPGIDADHRGGPCRCLTVFIAGTSARRCLDDLVARYGSVLPIHGDHPVLRRLMEPCLRAPADGRVRLDPAAAFTTCMTFIGMVFAQADAAARRQEGDSPAHTLAQTIVADPARRLSVAVEAARIGVTREHLTRAFSRLYGLPPAAWRRRLLCAEAMRLREIDGLPLKTVAAQLGFTDGAGVRRLLARAKRRRRP